METSTIHIIARMSLRTYLCIPHYFSSCLILDPNIISIAEVGLYKVSWCLLDILPFLILFWEFQKEISEFFRTLDSQIDIFWISLEYPFISVIMLGCSWFVQLTVMYSPFQICQYPPKLEISILRYRQLSSASRGICCRYIFVLIRRLWVWS